MQFSIPLILICLEKYRVDEATHLHSRIDNYIPIFFYFQL